MVAFSGCEIGAASSTKSGPWIGPCSAGATNALCVVCIGKSSRGAIYAAVCGVWKWVSAGGAARAQIQFWRVDRVSHQKFIRFRRVPQNALADVDEKSRMTCESHVQLNIVANKAIMRTFGPNQYFLHHLAGPRGYTQEKWGHSRVVRAISFKCHAFFQCCHHGNGVIWWNKPIHKTSIDELQIYQRENRQRQKIHHIIRILRFYRRPSTGEAVTTELRRKSTPVCFGHSSS